jgi:hypothetical protein
MMTDALELGGDLQKKPAILALQADIAGNECVAAIVRASPRPVVSAQSDFRERCDICLVL